MCRTENEIKRHLQHLGGSKESPGVDVSEDRKFRQEAEMPH